MYQNKKKNNNKIKIALQLLFTVALIVIMVFLSIPLSNKLKRQHSVNDEIKALKQEIEMDKQKNGELKEFVEYLSSDQFVEEKARMNLNYRKEGESVVVIKDENQDIENTENDFVYSSNAKTEKEEERFKNLYNWIDYFFN